MSPSESSSLMAGRRRCSASTLAVYQILLLLVVMTDPGYGQRTVGAESAASGPELLNLLQLEYSLVEDYQADIKAVLDIPGIRTPDMKAKIYFKQPDKFKVDSDGFAMLPRDAVHFSPVMFDPEQYDAVVQGSEKIRETNCAKLTLMARSDTVRIQRAVLFVDADRLIILKIKLTPTGGAPATVNFHHILVDDKFHMPGSIEIEMPAPASFRRMHADKSKNGEKKEIGRVQLHYSNYIVNRGLADSLFDSDN